MEPDLSPALKKTVNSLKDTFGDRIIETYQSTGDTFIRVDAGSITEICLHLRDTLHFVSLSDIIGSDRYTTDNRFEVMYNLFSFRDRTRLFVKIWLEEESPVADSVSGIWKSASWPEREVYDMFGIRFENHPDLRRMYMPEDFAYYPLRKEFPLLGIPGSIELPSSTPEND